MNSIGTCGRSRYTAAMARTASGLRDGGDALAEGAVADLVVILDEGDESGRGQIGAGLATRLAAIRHHLALEGEALGQRAAKFLGIAEILGVIPLVLAGRRRAEHVMDIVVPLRRIVQRLAVRAASEPSGLVLLVLQDQMHGPVRGRGAHAFGQFVQHMLGLSSMIACTASSRSPSRWNSSIQ